MLGHRGHGERALGPAAPRPPRCHHEALGPAARTPAAAPRAGSASLAVVSVASWFRLQAPRAAESPGHAQRRAWVSAGCGHARTLGPAPMCGLAASRLCACQCLHWCERARVRTRVPGRGAPGTWDLWAVPHQQLLRELAEDGQLGAGTQLHPFPHGPQGLVPREHLCPPPSCDRSPGHLCPQRIFGGIEPRAWGGRGDRASGGVLSQTGSSGQDGAEPGAVTVLPQHPGCPGWVPSCSLRLPNGPRAAKSGNPRPPRGASSTPTQLSQPPEPPGAGVLSPGTPPN